MNAYNTYQDPLLTNVSVKYTNPGVSFIAERLFPQVRVQKKTGIYFTYDKSNLKASDDVRTGKARANRVDYELTKTPYGPLVEHSLEYGIEDDEMEQYDSPHNARVDATETLTEKMLINKEKKLATMLTDVAIVTQNVTLTGGDKFSDYANSNPFDVIQTAKNTIQKNGLLQPNTCTMSYEAWAVMQHHPDLLERIKYSERGIITEDIFKALFGFQNLLIGSAVENTGEDGAADAMSYIWGKNMILSYVSPTPKLKAVSAGYHLQLKDARTIDWWDERPVKTQFVRITDYFDPHIVAQEAIYLIKDVV